MVLEVTRRSLRRSIQARATPTLGKRGNGGTEISIMTSQDFLSRVSELHFRAMEYHANADRGERVLRAKAIEDRVPGVSTASGCFRKRVKEGVVEGPGRKRRWRPGTVRDTSSAASHKPNGRSTTHTTLVHVCVFAYVR